MSSRIGSSGQGSRSDELVTTATTTASQVNANVTGAICDRRMTLECALTNQGNRRASVAPNDAMVRAFASREKPRRWRVRVDRVVRARGATTVAQGRQKHRVAALPWGRWALRELRYREP